jgi:hypothetical protein
MLMLTHWTAAGFDPEAFWDQNSATFNASMLGAEKRRTTDQSYFIMGAWMGEFFAREKKVKRLAEYLPKPPLTHEEEMRERDRGARELLQMMRRKKAAQEANGGKSNIKIKRVKRNG